MKAAVVSAGLLLLASPAGLAAQGLRELTSQRQYRGEADLAARVEVAAGRLRLGPAGAGTLYRMALLYDDARFTPIDRFAPGEGGLALGMSALGRGGTEARAEQAATIALSPRADLDLDVALGAATGRLDLGGLRVRALKVAAGASRAEVRFDAPNPIRCGEATFTATGAELVVTGLGHANCERVSFAGGVGALTLDFGGTWRGTMAVRAEVAVGGLVLRLPREAGVRVTIDRFLTSFSPSGLSRSADGTTWTSPRWTSADAKLDLAIETALGGITIEWID